MYGLCHKPLSSYLVTGARDQSRMTSVFLQYLWRAFPTSTFSFASILTDPHIFAEMRSEDIEALHWMAKRKKSTVATLAPKWGRIEVVLAQPMVGGS